jgi:hypothetical protein
MKEVLNLAEYLSETKKSKTFQKAFERWVLMKNKNANLQRLPIEKWEKISKEFLKEKI